jgi:hypothetical protein
MDFIDSTLVSSIDHPDWETQPCKEGFHLWRHDEEISEEGIYNLRDTTIGAIMVYEPLEHITYKYTIFGGQVKKFYGVLNFVPCN